MYSSTLVFFYKFNLLDLIFFYYKMLAVILDKPNPGNLECYVKNLFLRTTDYNQYDYIKKL